MIYLNCAGFIVYRIHNLQREYLLLHNAKGHWDFPKGKQEPKESLPEAAMRELHEETGLSLTPEAALNPAVWQYTEDGIPHTKTAYFFIGQAPEDASVVISPEHSAYRWLPLQEALILTQFPSARALLLEAEALIAGQETQ